MTRPHRAPVSGVVEERWVYAGVRNRDGLPVHAFVLDAGRGTTLHYTTVTKALSIGRIYRVMVSRADGATVLHGQPDDADDGRIDHPAAVARWRAHHDSAHVGLATHPTGRDTHRRDELGDALRPLRAIAVTMRTRTDRAAFTALVLDAITAEWTDTPTRP